ncbi:hypothetical protein, partial [Rhizobium leguminosarum]|uniref:hypothetical protein n=1 Tax=Rhizobium leguminosarum TaxID=384 RepID=UPI003F95469B
SPDPTRLHPANFPGYAGSTGLGDAIVVIPWVLYTHYGTIYEADMNSYNHYAYGAVCQWLFESLARRSPTTARRRSITSFRPTFWHARREWLRSLPE